MADYEVLKKDELIELADQKGIEVTTAMTKAEIIEALENGDAGVEDGEEQAEDTSDVSPSNQPGYDKAYAHAIKHGNSEKAAAQYASTYFKDFA